MKKFFLYSILFLMTFSFISCGDDVIPPENSDCTIEFELSAEKNETGNSIDVSKITDFYLLASANETTESVIVTYSDYEKISKAKFAFYTGTYDFTLNGTYETKPVFCSLKNVTLSSGENKLTFKMEFKNPQDAAEEVLKKMNLQISMEKPSHTDVNIQFRTEGPDVYFYIDDTGVYNADWYLDDKIFQSNSCECTIPVLLIRKNNTPLRVEVKKYSLFSETVYLSIPEIPELSVYASELETLELSENTLYRLHLLDKNPDLYLVGHCIKENPTVYFDLDLSACSELTEIKDFCFSEDTNISSNNKDNYPGKNILGITFGNGDKTVQSSGLSYTGLYYFEFGDGNITMKADPLNTVPHLTACYFGDGKLSLGANFSTENTNFKLVSIGYGNHNFDPGTFCSMNPEMIYIKGGDFTIPIGFSYDSDNGKNNYTKKVVIDGGNVTIEGAALSGSLEEFEFGDGNLTLKDGAFYNNNRMYSFKIGAGEHFIGAGVFSSNKKFEIVEIGEGDLTIRPSVFNNSSIEKLELKKGNKKFYEGSVTNCQVLKYVDFGDGDIELGNAAFNKSDWIEVIKKGKGNFVTNGNGTFTSPELRELDFGTGDIILGNSGGPTFQNLGLIEELDLTKAGGIVKMNGQSEFENCPNLRRVILPEDKGLDSIPAYAFYKAHDELEINIPASVKSIGQGAFDSSKNPTFNVSEKNEFYAATADKKQLLKIEDGEKKLFKNIDALKINDQIILGEGLTYLENFPAKEFEELRLPASLTKIESISKIQTEDSEDILNKTVIFTDSQNWYAATSFDSEDENYAEYKLELSSDGTGNYELLTSEEYKNCVFLKKDSE